MQLRKHQREITELCMRISAGEEISSIIAAVTPGGGKSALPVILSNLLIPEYAERLLWVVPRNSLKYQGEAEFLDPRWKTLHRLRAVNGNEADPARGNGGYITTYQAIGQNPFVHTLELGRHKYILFLDEPHHVARGSNWEAALARLVYGATLVVYASGTLYRGDGRPIAFIDKAAGPVIRYTRGDALRDGAVSPVHFRTLDGSAEWENEDRTKGSVDSLEEAGDYSPHALFTALRTEYAMELLWMCWRDYEREARRNPLAQMLVVAPSIRLAREYRNVLSRQIGIDVPIATSEDSKMARETIAAYRRGVHPVIVTVAMAYEGLSVPQISHIACLTHIRSVPWLEQCFARANRLAPGKAAGYIYGPADRKFLQAIHDIETEQGQAIKERESREAGKDIEEELTREAKPWINPLHSGMHEAGSFEELTFPPPRDFAPSELEKALRDQIRHLRHHVLNNTRRGNILSKTRIWNAIVRRTADKKIDEMSLSELEKVWVTLRARFGSEL